MTAQAISVTSLALNTKSSDLVAFGTTCAASDTFTLANPSGSMGRGRIIVVLEETNTGAATVTFNAGDYPPSSRKSLGSLAVTLDQADLRVIVLDASRFCQDDGTITGSVATNSVKISVLRIPNTI